MCLECANQKGSEFDVSEGSKVRSGQLPSLALAFADATGRKCTSTIGELIEKALKIRVDF